MTDVAAQDEFEARGKRVTQAMNNCFVSLHLELDSQIIEDVRTRFNEYLSYHLEAQHRRDTAFDWRKAGIVELAVENQSVKDYIEHWEGRALLAEKAIAEHICF